jgi:hypothetical protein
MYYGRDCVGIGVSVSLRSSCSQPLGQASLPPKRYVCAERGLGGSVLVQQQLTEIVFVCRVLEERERPEAETEGAAPDIP